MAKSKRLTKAKKVYRITNICKHLAKALVDALELADAAQKEEQDE